jgi:hypothetical protein
VDRAKAPKVATGELVTSTSCGGDGEAQEEQAQGEIE